MHPLGFSSWAFLPEVPLRHCANSMEKKKNNKKKGNTVKDCAWESQVASEQPYEIS